MKKEDQEEFTKERKLELVQRIVDPIAKIGAKTGDPEIFDFLKDATTALLEYIRLIDKEVIELYKDSIKYYEYKAIQIATDAVDELKANQFVKEMTAEELKAKFDTEKTDEE